MRVMVHRWEYLVLRKPDRDRDFTDWLDDAGRAGWELAGVTGGDELIFKRPTGREDA